MYWLCLRSHHHAALHHVERTRSSVNKLHLLRLFCPRDVSTGNSRCSPGRINFLFYYLSQQRVQVGSLLLLLLLLLLLSLLLLLLFCNRNLLRVVAAVSLRRFNPIFVYFDSCFVQVYQVFRQRFPLLLVRTTSQVHERPRWLSVGCRHHRTSGIRHLPCPTFYSRWLD